MPCSKEALVKLFLNLTVTCKLLFLFIYFSSLLFTKLFIFLCSRGDDDEYSDEDVSYCDEEEEDVAEVGTYQPSPVDRSETATLAADDGETDAFWSTNCPRGLADFDEHGNPYDDDLYESFYDVPSSVSISPKPESEQNMTEDVPRRDDFRCAQRTGNLLEISLPPRRCASRSNRHASHGGEVIEETKDNNFGKDDKFLIFTPPKREQRKLNVLDTKQDDGIFGEEYSNNVGSTSKSSSDWRSSMQDSDPFSSSSRRNCHKWESYTVFQKYDEEMIVLDQISAQKLRETESLRSFKRQPRSISERIVYKFSTDKMRSSYVYHQNSYHELEAAYVSQICLTWEALNCNYYNFKRKRASQQHGSDLGCPAEIGQQFQQFQVLLQRYIENEPFEYGRRPEIYARIRTMAPKLLQVPEYQDYEDEHEEQTASSRISSAWFTKILENAIQTFLHFLEADQETHCQLLTALFRRNRRGSVDPVLLHITGRKNKKMKRRLKDLRRADKCFRKRKLTKEEDIEILLGLIDLKVVSRVLRMSDITHEQLRWCEEKMNRVKISQGKLYRDSSPLFLPSRNMLL